VSLVKHEFSECSARAVLGAHCGAPLAHSNDKYYKFTIDQKNEAATYGNMNMNMIVLIVLLILCCWCCVVGG